MAPVPQLGVLLACGSTSCGLRSVLPAFRRTCSPRYRCLALVGSGAGPCGFAATCRPALVRAFDFDNHVVIDRQLDAGRAGKSTGWEYPTVRRIPGGRTSALYPTPGFPALGEPLGHALDHVLDQGPGQTVQPLCWPLRTDAPPGSGCRPSALELFVSFRSTHLGPFTFTLEPSSFTVTPGERAAAAYRFATSSTPTTARRSARRHVAFARRDRTSVPARGQDRHAQSVLDPRNFPRLDIASQSRSRHAASSRITEDSPVILR